MMRTIDDSLDHIDCGYQGKLGKSTCCIDGQVDGGLAFQGGTKRKEKYSVFQQEELEQHPCKVSRNLVVESNIRDAKVWFVGTK